jgi:hypothetical protein
MKRDDSVYLIHILDSIYQVEEYTESLTKEEFLAKRLVQDGTIRKFFVASPMISRAFVTAYMVFLSPENSLYSISLTNPSISSIALQGCPVKIE